MAEGDKDRIKLWHVSFTVPVVAIIRINRAKRPAFAMALAAGLGVGVGAFAATNWWKTERAIKESLNRKDENGKLVAEAKNMKINSITVELHCYTKQSVLQFVKDFKENEVKRRLEEEFKKIGFDAELEVTLVNAEEVFQREEELRSLTVLEEGDKGTVGEVNVDPSKSMEELKKIEEDLFKTMKEKEEMLKEHFLMMEEKESFLQEKEKMLKDPFKGMKEKEEMLKDKEKMFKEFKESSEGPSKLIKGPSKLIKGAGKAPEDPSKLMEGAGKAPEDPSKLMEEASEGQEEKRESQEEKRK